MPETETSPFLSSGQRRLLAFAIGLFAAVATIALIAFVIVVLVGFFSGVLWPLATGRNRRASSNHGLHVKCDPIPILQAVACRRVVSKSLVRPLK